MNDFRKLEQIYGLEVFPKRDVMIVRGENATVWDSDELKDPTQGDGGPDHKADLMSRHFIQ